MIRKRIAAYIAGRIVDGCADFIDHLVEKAAVRHGSLDKDSQEYKDYQAAMQEFRDTLKKPPK